MALSDDRQQVLRMIEEGNISPREGARLLMALAELGDEAPPGGEPQQILRMVEEAKISVEDGTRLIISLGGLGGLGDKEPSHDGAAASTPPVPSAAGKQVRITVKRNDGNMVRLSIPLEGARMVLPPVRPAARGAPRRARPRRQPDSRGAALRRAGRCHGLPRQGVRPQRPHRHRLKARPARTCCRCAT